MSEAENFQEATNNELRCSHGSNNRNAMNSICDGMERL